MLYKVHSQATNHTGCLNLAVCYRNAGNLRRAKFWFERARQQGDGSAAYELGKIYFGQRPSISSKQWARQYFAEAMASKYITEDEREEAKALLSTLKNV